MTLSPDEARALEFIARVVVVSGLAGAVSGSLLIWAIRNHFEVVEWTLWGAFAGTLPVLAVHLAALI